MICKNFVRIGLLGSLVAIAILSGPTSAEAGWWHHGSSGGSWGSSGGSWGSSGGSWGSSGGSWGGGWHHHRAYYGSSGYSYGSSGGYGYSYGSSGYSTAYYGGSSGGYYGSYYGGSYNNSYSSDCCNTCGEGNVIYGNAAPSQMGPPATPVPPTTAPSKTGADNSTTYNINGLSNDAVYIAANVPENAKIFVNGRATKSTGTNREFISHGLQAGKQYSYEFRMELDGKTETKTVRVTAGQRTQLAFNDAPATLTPVSVLSSDATKTTIVLEVPENAKVTLSGKESSLTGTRREFTTSKLVAGDKWENYTIRVEAEVNGEVKTSEKTITVNAGDQQTLTFFADEAKALVRTASAK